MALLFYGNNFTRNVQPVSQLISPPQTALRPTMALTLKRPFQKCSACQGMENGLIYENQENCCCKDINDSDSEGEAEKSPRVEQVESSGPPLSPPAQSQPHFTSPDPGGQSQHTDSEDASEAETEPYSGVKSAPGSGAESTDGSTTEEEPLTQELPVANLGKDIFAENIVDND